MVDCAELIELADMACWSGIGGRLLLGGLLVSTWGLKVTLRIAFGDGAALLGVLVVSEGLDIRGVDSPAGGAMANRGLTVDRKERRPQ